MKTRSANIDRFILNFIIYVHSIIDDTIINYTDTNKTIKHIIPAL